MRDVADRVSMAEEIHKSNTLRDLIQRQVNKSRAATEITSYLLMQEQRLFNALVIGVYGGAPNWYELAIHRDERYKIESAYDYLDETLGILSLEGSENLFALDGQHRVVGIKGAIEKDSALGEEEVAAIFVAHKNTPSGMERTRRLFTTLNRYAKPVNKKEKIALDEDDVIAIITRRLIDEYPLFREKISVAGTKSIPPTDKKSFTTIITLYDVLVTFFRQEIRDLEYKLRLRPPDDTVDFFHEEATELWDAMIENFPPLQEVAESQSSDEVPGKYRGRDGGHLLFRPIGLLIVLKVIRQFVDSGLSLQTAARRVAQAPMDLANDPWVSLLWDAVNHRMITASENQRAATSMLYSSLGGNLKKSKTSPTAKGIAKSTPKEFKISIEELREELAGLLNIEIGEVVLPKFVSK